MNDCKQYTSEYTIKILNQEIKENASGLYKCDCVNWQGNTTDSAQPFTEVISDKLLNIELNMERVIRTKPYINHYPNLAKINPESNRKEEKKAIELYNDGMNGREAELGRIIEYQVPIKGERADTSGKIDLISYDKFNNTLYLIELKVDGHKGTLLSALLEIETYFRQINIEKLVFEFIEKQIVAKGCIVKKALLLYPGCTAYREYENIENRPALNNLIKKYETLVCLGM